MIAIHYADPKDMATDAITGQLCLDDPIYELGKALREACERIEEYETVGDENWSLLDKNERLQAAVDEMKENTVGFVADVTLLIRTSSIEDVGVDLLQHLMDELDKRLTVFAREMKDV